MSIVIATEETYWADDALVKAAMAIEVEVGSSHAAIRARGELNALIRLVFIQMPKCIRDGDSRMKAIHSASGGNALSAIENLAGRVYAEARRTGWSVADVYARLVPDID